MNPPSRPSLAQTAIAMPRIRAYVNAPGSSTPPVMGGELHDWEVLRIERHAGSSPDTITLARKMTAHIVDRYIQRSGTQQVEVWLLAANGRRLAPLAWGETVRQELTIADGNEQEVLHAEINRWHFGDPLLGETVYDKAADDVYIVHRDARFNPRIDDRITPNRGIVRDNTVQAAEGDADQHYVWVDPEAGRKPEAFAEHDPDPDDPPEDVAELWTLDQALDTLAQILNGDEQFITNAVVRDADGNPADILAGAINPDNMMIKRGSYLPEILDDLLHPRGFNWCVQIAAGEDVFADQHGNDGQLATRTIRLFQRGAGTLKSLRLQAPGNSVDPLKTSLLQFQGSVDLSQLANRIVAHGSLIQREVTIPLYKGWAEDDDALTVEQLTRGADDTQLEDKPDVHRKWVANESGEWTDLRPEITETLDLSSIHDAFKLPKRRPLDVPLTYQGKADDEEGGLRRDKYLEWRTDSEAEWQVWQGQEFDLLEDQCGIYFGGDHPPPELLDHEDAELRVTGTLTGDQAYEAIREPTGDSAQTNPITLFLDVHDRFHNRQRQTDGDYQSVLISDHPEADEADDDAALDDYVINLLETVDIAAIQASITLFGLRGGYDISDQIEKIDGREIVLNRRANQSVGDAKYLQVIGITWDVSGQQTVLHTAAFDS